MMVLVPKPNTSGRQLNKKTAVIISYFMMELEEYPVKPEKFEDQELGEYIRIWEVDHNRNLGEIFGSLITTTFGGWTILEHKWTLWGLALGDPCYILGKAENRPKNIRKKNGLLKTALPQYEEMTNSS
ncbi:MAG: hypothetical protein Ct9H90mP24_1060 [Methanobacteriota archaeon]|nr:MAG: hypothetical protein Ct9H90mP24_1060 [Euryarchaeota archaeon]